MALRAAVLLLLLVPLGAARAESPVEVEVEGVRLDPDTGSPVVLLTEKGPGARQLPIWVGPFEAEAIALELGGIAPSRPMTHDLMKRLVEALGGRLDRVVITQLEGHTYLALIHLDAPPRGPLRVDARPSDAIALALRLRCPILVEPEVFPADQPPGPRAAALRPWGLTVQELTPQLRDLLALADVHGALVSDVDDRGPARKLHRGDVILRVDGRPVGSPSELRGHLAAAGSPAVHLSLWRDGRDLEVKLRTADAR